MSDYRILINFLPVLDTLPNFTVYRMPVSKSTERPFETVTQYSLPASDYSENWEKYWISPAPFEGFTEYVVKAEYNIHLTRHFFYLGVCESVRKQLKTQEFYIPSNSFVQELSLIMHEHREGQESLKVQPYYLHEKGQFGCVVDYHFRKRPEIPFSRRVQELSLSLDRAGRRNLNCYVDRVSKISEFLSKRKGIFQSIQIPGSTISISLDDNFVSLPAQRLDPKIYICGNKGEDRSQFRGLKRHGPLQQVTSQPHLLFCFREQDRQAARTLAMALKGTKNREQYAFPGFDNLFKTDISIDSDPSILPDLSESSFRRVQERVILDRERESGTFPVFILPESDDNGYMLQKALFANSGIPTQVCTLPLIQDENALKWAISNIALQIFCKAGGQPWKVKPTKHDTLIIGISQSHKIKKLEERQIVEKYFAFSVMTDNSGLFQSIQVMGESGNHGEYLSQLQNNLKNILNEASKDFSQVVLHTSFKLKNDEMRTIQSTVNNAAKTKTECLFSVIKINHVTRFFGSNENVNSLVPYEATNVRLGKNEYLLWFEGLLQEKPTVTKAYPGPTHIEFLRIKEGPQIDSNDLLQDLINLSGANWRGFNAKSAPISVFYCHLVADLVHEFHDRGLPLPSMQDLRPWFL